MDYKIINGDRFLCLESYLMDDEIIAYTKGKMYFSESDGTITDDSLNATHKMNNQIDFFEYFKLVPFGYAT